MKPRITSVSATGTQLPVDGQAANDAHMRAAASQWHDRWPEGSARWSERPDSLIADFLRASVRDLVAVYGDGAVVRAAQVLAIQVALNGQLEVDLTGAWPEAGASMQLSLRFAPRGTPTAQGLDMVVETSESDTPDEVVASVQEQLRQWHDGHVLGDGIPSLVLDPVTMLPDRTLAALVRGVEKQWAGEDWQVLLAASAAVLAWQSMEACRANVFSLAIEGLTHGGETIMDGMEARFLGAARLLDPTPEPPSTEPTQTVGIAMRKARRQ